MTSQGFKIPPWKRRNIYKPPIFGFHVSFQRGNLLKNTANTTVYLAEEIPSLARHPLDAQRWEGVRNFGRLISAFFGS